MNLKDLVLQLCDSLFVCSKFQNRQSIRNACVFFLITFIHHVFRIGRSYLIKMECPGPKEEVAVVLLVLVSVYHTHTYYGFSDHLNEALDNMWLLDPRTGKWEEASIDSNKQFKYILQRTLYDQYI